MDSIVKLFCIRRRQNFRIEKPKEVLKIFAPSFTLKMQADGEIY